MIFLTGRMRQRKCMKKTGKQAEAGSEDKSLADYVLSGFIDPVPPQTVCAHQDGNANGSLMSRKLYPDVRRRDEGTRR
jgi:hypothetical protein